MNLTPLLWTPFGWRGKKPCGRPQELQAQGAERCARGFLACT